MLEIADNGWTLPEDAQILAVGAGTGVEISHLAAVFPKWRFTALDPSGAMLAECRRMKLVVHPPDLNRGDFRFTVPKPGEIVYGLGAIKGVGDSLIYQKFIPTVLGGLPLGPP